MTSLATKYGPVNSVAAAAAAGQLESYARIARAALEGRDGAIHAPILLLTNEQLVALFAPRQLTALVRYPLERPAHDCT